MNNSLLIKNIGDLVTLSPLAENQKVAGIVETDLGRLTGKSWLHVENGKIKEFGRGNPSDDLCKTVDATKIINAKGGLVLPGLVDAHTHPIYGGNRASEFARRLTGETYQSIAAAGGGIKYTVKCTREASDDELSAFMEKKLKTFLSHGVTTVEAKSGYGLSIKDELRILRCIQKVSGRSPQKIVATCLALHAVMPEYESTEQYIDTVINDLLPKIADEKLAAYVDAFVENGYFSVEQTQPYVDKAQELGLNIRIHADEFADAGAALAAARWQAHSADHLEHASNEAIEAMAAAKTVAVLLPGTSLYTAIDYAKADRFKAAGCPIALATDYNPGSCQIDNLPFVATLGALHCGLTPSETMAAVTYVPAFSLRLHEQKGALAIGHDADISLYLEMSRMEEWIADLGRRSPTLVFANGVSVI